MKTPLLLSVCMLFATSLWAQDPIYEKDGIAIEGYDVVSYFEGEPVKGSSDYTSELDDVTFYFASEDHRMEFDKAPLKYLPQYGGYCAYAMAKNGELVSINPEAYLIQDEKLYLFYKAWGVNTLKKWQKEDEASLRKAADAQWQQHVQH